MTQRPLDTLPKAHLHLHFTGSMRPTTLVDLAQRNGVRLPSALTGQQMVTLSPDERGWFRFQRLYDAARACVRTAEDMRRIVLEAAADDAAEGSRWLELQVDPTSYAVHVGGITPALEIVLAAAREASELTGTGVAVVVAASRMRHPLDARVLARLAARYAGEGPGTVVGFGLSNDERRGTTAEFAGAFAIARRAGLAAVPHSGELLGPAHVTETLRTLRPDRLGHGVRSAEDPAVLARLVDAGVALEVCPTSNVSLGVYSELAGVPLRRLLAAGATLALGADDPLLFGPRLVEQYRSAREDHGLDDAALAGLARGSITASRAPAATKARLLTDVDAWLSQALAVSAIG
ncbi:adenosine deaminase [Kineococcus sp. R8]|uniref:adenosine deaminase n=1 Tax=Kineococcus siccus TaxID=2696567 RepID=UPI001412577F|nr:adenosine deaminase [Kineococcus siccus]